MRVGNKVKMELSDYFSTNFQVKYVPPKVSETQLLESFWNALTTIPGSKKELRREYFPGTVIWAYFFREDEATYHTKVVYSSRKDHISLECEFKPNLRYTWTIVSGKYVSFTQGGGMDRETWFAEFAEHFRNAKSS